MRMIYQIRILPSNLSFQKFPWENDYKRQKASVQIQNTGVPTVSDEVGTVVGTVHSDRGVDGIILSTRSASKRENLKPASHQCIESYSIAGFHFSHQSRCTE